VGVVKKYPGLQMKLYDFCVWITDFRMTDSVLQLMRTAMKQWKKSNENSDKKKEIEISD